MTKEEVGTAGEGNQRRLEQEVSSYQSPAPCLALLLFAVKPAPCSLRAGGGEKREVRDDPQQSEDSQRTTSGAA